MNIEHSFHSPRTSLARALLGVALCGGAWQAAAQDTATFNVSGTLLASCGFEGTNIEFPLGQVPTSKFNNTGSYSDYVEASLVSTGCPGVTNVKMRFQGQADANDGTLFAVSGGATGVGVELRAYGDNLAEPNGALMRWTPRPSGSPYRYKARYKRTGATLNPGDANANITVSIEYD